MCGVWGSAVRLALGCERQALGGVRRGDKRWGGGGKRGMRQGHAISGGWAAPRVAPGQGIGPDAGCRTEEREKELGEEGSEAGE